MQRRTSWLVLGAVIAAAGCAPDSRAEQNAAAGEEMQATSLVPDQQVPVCQPSSRMAVEGRQSPYDSITVALGEATAKLCYGRPSLRGRTMIGGQAVPYGRLWRTGANEPTILHLPVAASIAGIAVQPGSYSLYTVPAEGDWTVIVNRSTSQWGHESAYTPEVEAQEVGRATVRSTRVEQPIEMLTFRATPSERGADLVLEWQNTRVTIPIQRS